MWIFIYFLSLAIVVLGIALHVFSNKDTFKATGLSSILIGMILMVISIIFTSKLQFNSKKYTSTIKTTQTIVNDSIVKCDTFYVITPK